MGLPREKQTKQINTARLWSAVIESVTKLELLNKSQMITDMAIHRYLQFPLLYRALFKNIDFLGVISGREVSEKLKSEFDIKNVKQYLIRGEAGHPGVIQERHYPDTFNKLFDSIDVPFPGALFIVGAGVFGKIYCKWIKDRGGIALDIGSIFKAWAKTPSRTTHPCHHLDVYKEITEIDVKCAINRYNHFCDKFEMDTPRASVNADYFSKLPSSW